MLKIYANDKHYAEHDFGPLQMTYANDHNGVVMMMMLMLMILMIMMIEMMITLSLVICGCHHCKPFARRLHGERLMKPFLQKM